MGLLGRCLLQAGVVAVVSVIAVACGNEEGSEFGANGKKDAGFDPNITGDAGFGDGSIADADFWAKDPPAQWCGPDGGGGAPPPDPGGTPDCPDDKNKEGCPCPEVGKSAACWPGLRAKRNLGVCKDGQTTCKQTGELTRVWGPCEGAVLPSAGATKGKDACGCFSEGRWALTNITPCFFRSQKEFDPDKIFGAVSTIEQSGGAPAKCPDFHNPPVVGSPTWSKDTLKVDCAGTFTLCYELKGGDFNNPQASDCSLSGKICLPPTYYPEKNVEMPFPDLGSWASTDAECAKKFAKEGGYGEMSVVGESVVCDKIDDGSGNSYVFNRIQYCKAECSEISPPPPGCESCLQNGSGKF